MRVSPPDSERGSPGSKRSTRATSQLSSVSRSASAAPKIPAPTMTAEGMPDISGGPGREPRSAHGQRATGGRGREPPDAIT